MRRVAALLILVGGASCDLDESKNSYTSGAAFAPAPAPAGSPGSLMHFPAPVDGRMPRLVAAGDVDGDGLPDLLLGRVDEGGTPGPTILDLHLGLASGGFALLPAASVDLDSSAEVVETADVDGDGNLDLLVAVSTDASGGRVDLLLGAGDGSFGPATAAVTGLDVLRMSTGDFDGDGARDLVLGGSAETWVVMNDGTGIFDVPVVYPYASYFTALDVEGDGVDELAIVEEGGGGWVEVLSDAMWGGTILAVLMLPAGEQGMSLAAADTDGDGFVDLAVGTGSPVSPDAGHLRLFRGDGAGGFGLPQELDVQVNVTCLAVLDYDGDGRADFAATGSGSADRIFLVSGAGTLPSWSLAATDPGCVVGTSVPGSAFGAAVWGDETGFHLLGGGSDLSQAPP